MSAASQARVGGQVGEAATPACGQVARKGNIMFECGAAGVHSQRAEKCLAEFPVAVRKGAPSS